MVGTDSSDHSTRRTQTLHAHKPTCKLRANFTKPNDKTYIAEKHNAIYIFPQTSLTEHQNVINRHDLSSLPAKYTNDNGHKFDWSHTRCLGQATTKQARERV